LVLGSSVVLFDDREGSMAREKLQEVVRDGLFMLCYERIRNGSVQGALVSRAQVQVHVYSDAASHFQTDDDGPVVGCQKSCTLVHLISYPPLCKAQSETKNGAETPLL
jgi:hypothetical protein